MDGHNEISFSLLIHELLSTHLKHTFYYVTLGCLIESKLLRL
jgi:hypothetical protein